MRSWDMPLIAAYAGFASITTKPASVISIGIGFSFTIVSDRYRSCSISSFFVFCDVISLYTNISEPIVPSSCITGIQNCSRTWMPDGSSTVTSPKDRRFSWSATLAPSPVWLMIRNFVKEVLVSSSFLMPLIRT